MFLNIFNRNLPRTDTYQRVASSGGFVVGEAEYDEFFSDDEDDEREEDTELILEAADALVDGVVDGIGAGINGIGPAAHGQIVAVRRVGDVIDEIPISSGNEEDELPPFPVDETADVGILDDSIGAIETQTFTATITPDTPVLERHDGGQPGEDSGFLDPNDAHDDARSGISEIEVQVTTSVRGSPEIRGQDVNRNGIQHDHRHYHHHHDHSHGGYDGRRRGGGRERSGVADRRGIAAEDESAGVSLQCGDVRTKWGRNGVIGE
ncbi:hypothetical protein ABW19_dt0206337 [Dactylella cylindrospora]|nr:hypothetical protein ABW19_dt0206337 [Dactylella cylindrospora]